jgi:hypothetical protein
MNDEQIQAVTAEDTEGHGLNSGSIHDDTVEAESPSGELNTYWIHDVDGDVEGHKFVPVDERPSVGGLLPPGRSGEHAQEKVRDEAAPVAPARPLDPSTEPSTPA